MVSILRSEIEGQRKGVSRGREAPSRGSEAPFRPPPTEIGILWGDRPLKLEHGIAVDEDGILIMFENGSRLPSPIFDELQNNNVPVAFAGHRTFDSAGNVTEKCAGQCGRVYIERAGEVDEVARRQIQSLLCGPTRPVFSSKPLIIGAGAGTTGTQSIAYALSLLGLHVLHFTQLWLPWGRIDQTVSNPAQEFSLNRIWGFSSAESSEECLRQGNAFDFSVFARLDAVFDSPIPEYSYDLIQGYPNSRVILTLRDPWRWDATRRERHDRPSAHYLRSCGRPLNDLGNDSSQALFSATNEFIECRTGQDRLLKLDVFDTSKATRLWGDLMDFVGVQNHTLRNHCSFPKFPGHLVCFNESHWTNRGTLQIKPGGYANWTFAYEKKKKKR